MAAKRCDAGTDFGLAWAGDNRVDVSAGVACGVSVPVMGDALAGRFADACRRSIVIPLSIDR